MMFLISLYPTTILMSIMFTQLKHPLAMGLGLLLQTIVICCVSGLHNISFWFSYILFLIFLGGILVLFIYVTSLASNNMFKFSLTSLIFILPTLLISFCLMFMDPLSTLQYSSLNSSIGFKQMPYSINTSLISTIYNSTNMNLTIFMVYYLLLTLVVVVKVTDSFFGPLRLSSN
uniref:NADH-ubiquinone oxidoreductase chain 6 n=1 Tax=Pseudeuphausia sinica TaxID=296748 RepID=A0A5Q2MVD6_9EUCA|nr:NADH dehydrogenase subunit 6 [Pseudeuphausia sinica]QGG46164.1 NADH dehydrogenase subunit 6 [Pseudeuphausia sinica]